MKKTLSFGDQHRLQHGLSTDEHEFFYEFLLISPSYFKAHLFANGLLEDPSELATIKDWPLVVQTYELCGDIYSTPFLKWWDATGRQLFYTEQVDGTYQPTGKLNFLTNKVNEMTLIEALGLVNDKSRIEMKSGKKISNWQLGVESGVNSKWVQELKGSTKKTFENLEARNTLGVLVSKKLKEALYIAENAARGRFPSVSLINSGLKFDYATQFDRTKQILALDIKDKRERKDNSQHVPRTYYARKVLPKLRKFEKVKAQLVSESDKKCDQ